MATAGDIGEVPCKDLVPSQTREMAAREGGRAVTRYFARRRAQSAMLWRRDGPCGVGVGQHRDRTVRCEPV